MSWSCSSDVKNLKRFEETKYFLIFSRELEFEEVYERAFFVGLFFTFNLRHMQLLITTIGETVLAIGHNLCFFQRT